MRSPLFRRWFLHEECLMIVRADRSVRPTEIHGFSDPDTRHGGSGH
jgi:hypothetical protein